MKICSVDGCERAIHGRSYCRAHYMRWWRFGDPTAEYGPRGKRPAVPLMERLDGRYQETPGGCWIWLGATHGNGYGEVFLDGKREYVHRAVFMTFVGRLEPGQVVRHACDTPLCVRPEHLVAGTQADNVRDMADRERWRNQYAAGKNNPHRAARRAYKRKGAA